VERGKGKQQHIAASNQFQRTEEKVDLASFFFIKREAAQILQLNSLLALCQFLPKNPVC